MVLHEVQLKGYSVRPSNLSLGTFDSYGIEQLHVTTDDSWDGLDILAVFHAPDGTVTKVVAGADGMLAVPSEATANQAGNGRIVFVGLAENVQRITVDMGYNIKPHSDIEGDNPGVPTPDVVQQILQAALNAEQNSAESKSVAEGLRNDAASGKFDGKDGAKGDKGETGTTPQLKIGEDNLWQVSYDNGATWVSLGVKATGEAGKDGKDGKNGLTPHIGENGNWWVGDTDTGVSAKGDTGAKGADGVSPTASVTQTDDGAEFTVTDASGTTTATIKNGINGKDGAPGAPGKDAVVDATLTQDGQAADAKVTGEKIGELKEDTAALKKRQNVLIGSETGNPASCNDAFAAPLCGLNVYGKSTQDGTPSPDNPVPIVSAGDGGSVAVRVTGKNLLNISDGSWATRGITVTAKDGLISISGTATSSGYAWLNVRPFIISSVVILSSSITSPKVKLVSGKWGVILSQNVANKMSDVATRIVFVVTEGQTYNLTGIKVQIELGTTATTYEPYREQLLTLSTPNGLPGIPVTSGGNYTDQNGQQWICDEVDLERGVKVQRVKSRRILSSEVKDTILGVNSCYIIEQNMTRPANNRQIGHIMCTHLERDTWSRVVDNGAQGICATGDQSYIGITIQGFKSANEYRDFMDKNEVGIAYELATPIETPLTPAEIAAYKDLTAYAPDTVVQASDGAGVKLEYQKDVNIAIKKLEDAIASMTAT